MHRVVWQASVTNAPIVPLYTVVIVLYSVARHVDERKRMDQKMHNPPTPAAPPVFWLTRPLCSPVDPLQTPEKAERMKLAELKNGRLAMMAVSGALTQMAMTGHGFPFLN